MKERQYSCVFDLSEKQKKNLIKKVHRRSAISSCIAGIFFFVLTVLVAWSVITYPWKYDTIFWGRFMIVNALNIFACLCFRRGNTARVSGGNIFLYILAFIAFWATYIWTDYINIWRDLPYYDKSVGIFILNNSILFLESVLSFATLHLIHKNRWFESKDRRFASCENGKMHPAVCGFALLFSISPSYILAIVFTIAAIYRQVQVSKEKQHADWYDLEYTMEEMYENGTEETM